MRGVVAHCRRISPRYASTAARVRLGALAVRARPLGSNTSAMPSVDPLVEENEALRRELVELKRKLAPEQAAEPAELSKFAGIRAASYTHEPKFYYPFDESPPCVSPPVRHTRRC